MSDNHSKPLMLMFTIGPVQSFIEAARKTEDLWMGSYILSYLVATAMKKVQGTGVEIIYPAVGTESPFGFWMKRSDFRTPSFPNLFLAIGDGITITEKDLIKRAENAESVVKTEFERMAECAVNVTFGGKWQETYASDIFNRQVLDFFDIYWVITEETGSDYGKWYEHTAGSLAAIKNCRVFEQTSEFGRKCSLDGTREILHKKEGKDEREQIKNAMEWWDKFAKRRPKFCRPKEALCAVSLTKRMGRHYLINHSEFKNEFSKEFSTRSLSFPSTSEVATASFKERFLCKPSALGVYAQFVEEVKKLRGPNDKLADIPYISPLPKISDCLSEKNIDGEWLYEETYNDSYLERYYNIDVLKAAHQIQKCKDLRKKLVEVLKGEPGKYYAAIALDADNMGEVNRKAENKEQHKGVSRKLIEYTETAREIVEEKHLGKLTYAGGDDLLALANLKDLLPMLKGLREEFPCFTSASAGVCIAHNKMPLGDVLRHARRMEQAAKLKYSSEKDAFGIALFKRSGNVSEVVTKWRPPYTDLDVLAISEELAKLLRDNEVSKRFLYDFRETFTKLVEGEDNFPADLDQVIESEFMRIMKNAHSNKGTQNEVNQQIMESIAELIYYIQPFSDFLGSLEIVSFIARE